MAQKKPLRFLAETRSAKAVAERLRKGFFSLCVSGVQIRRTCLLHFSELKCQPDKVTCAAGSKGELGKRKGSHEEEPLSLGITAKN